MSRHHYEYMRDLDAEPKPWLGPCIIAAIAAVIFCLLGEERARWVGRRWKQIICLRMKLPSFRVNEHSRSKT